MKLCTVTEFKELIKAYPNGGVVFTEYDQPQDLLLTDGFFSARLTLFLMKKGTINF